MKKNGFELNTKDYDVYSFHLPVSVLFGKKRERFLVTELGKRHPCFSDEYCFDSKVSLRKTGFEAEAVVMKKMRLAELKMETNGKRMYVRESCGFVFDSGVLLMLKESFLWIVLGILLCAILVVMMTVGEKNGRMEEEKSASDVEIERKTVVVRKRVCTDEFLEIVKNEKGRLDWFEWRCEENLESFSACVNLLYPELFYKDGGKMEVSAVSYKDGKPSMIVKEKIVSSSIGKNNNTMNFVFVIPVIREILKKENVEIFEENQDPFSVKFRFKTDFDENNNVLCKIGKAAADNNLSISYLMLKYSGAGMFDVQIRFSRVLGESVDVEKVGRFIKLFEREEGGNVMMKGRSVVPERKVSMGKKIGEVKRNGERVVFFKGEDGKVRWETGEN